MILDILLVLLLVMLLAFWENKPETAPEMAPDNPAGNAHRKAPGMCLAAKNAPLKCSWKWLKQNAQKPPRC